MMASKRRYEPGDSTAIPRGRGHVSRRVLPLPASDGYASGDRHAALGHDAARKAPREPSGDLGPLAAFSPPVRGGQAGVPPRPPGRVSRLSAGPSFRGGALYAFGS